MKLDTKIIIFLSIICMILFLVGNASAHILDVPPYITVNTTGTIRLIEGTDAGIVAQETAYIFLDGVYSPMTKASNNKSFSIGVTSTQREDKTFTLTVYNSSSDLELINNSDSTQESSLLIADSRLYGFKLKENDTTIEGEIEYHQACFYIAQSLGSPQVTSYVGVNNGSVIIWTTNGIRTITSSVYDYYCFDHTQTYTQNITNKTEYFVLSCVNCGPSIRINLGLDTNSIKNNSVQINNLTTNNVTNITTSNYMIKALEVDGVPDENIIGTLLFRVPFYLDITLYNNFNTTLKTKFDYIYVKKVDASNFRLTASDGQAITSWFTGLLGMNTRRNIDTSLVHWAAVNGVNDDTAHIKLYESGNYTVTLLTMKTFMPTGWGYEFIKPQYTTSKVETRINSFLEIQNETDTTSRIYLSEYEANKKSYVFNYIKWIVWFLVLFIGIIAAIKSDEPLRALGAVLSIWFTLTLILTFFGVL